MRGLRFLILLLVAIPVAWYAYYDSKKGRSDDSPKRDKVFTVESDKIDEIEVKSESGDRTTMRKKGTDWEIVQPVSVRTDQAAVSGITTNLSSVEIQRVIDDNPPDSEGIRPGGTPRRGGVQGKRSAAPLAARTEDTRRLRRLRQAARQQTGISDPVISRFHVQSRHVRSSRQVSAEDRSGKGRRPRSQRWQPDAEVREEER